MCIFSTLFLFNCNLPALEKNNSEESLNTNFSPSTLQQAPSDLFHNYWYAGDAELSTYHIKQARYGEIHEGISTLIFVTEPFLPQKQVKADRPESNDLSVLKLNMTKKFYTGIYPYSLMSSIFFPVYFPEEHAVKISTSSQEWCGHTYTQLNHRNQKFEIHQNSYFQTEADTHFHLPLAHLEDELWLKIRINPEILPLGEISIVPSFLYIRLLHRPLQVYQAIASKEKSENALLTQYKIYYPELERTLVIVYQTNFPHSVESWTETYKSGWGESAKILTSTATKIKTLKYRYWQLNHVADSVYRKELGINNEVALINP